MSNNASYISGTVIQPNTISCNSHGFVRSHFYVKEGFICLEIGVVSG